jgi:methionyl aminopeptidase
MADCDYVGLNIQMVNLGTKHDTHHWPDDWTATTVDGRRSAQFEETLL